MKKLMLFFPLGLICLYLASCGGTAGDSSSTTTTTLGTTTTTVQSTPSAPLNLSAAPGDHQITLTWEAAASATNYRIYEHLIYSSYEVAGTTTETAYLASNLQNAFPYFFKVKSINSVGESDFSVETSTTPHGNSLDISVEEGLIHGPDGTITPSFSDEMFRSLAVAPTDPNVIYVGSEGNGIFRSTDGGITWSWIRNGLKYGVLTGVTTSYAETYDLAIDPNNSNLAYAAQTSNVGPPTGNYLSAAAGIYKTTTGGSSWSRKMAGFLNGSTTSIAVDPTNPSILYAGLSSGTPNQSGLDVSDQYFAGSIYKSTDAGENWTKLDLPTTLSASSEYWRIVIRGSKVFTLGQKWEEPASAIGLLKSEDAGTSWTSIPAAGMELHDFDVGYSDPETIYGLDWRTNTFYKTSNNGSSWTTVPRYAYGVVRISPHTDQTVLFSNRKEVYKSTDGVATWTFIFSAEADVNDIEFSASNANILYVGTAGLKIYKSTDGGNNFSRVADLRQYINTH